MVISIYCCWTHPACTQYAYVTAGVFHCLQWATPIISLEIHTNLKEGEERGINTLIINIHWLLVTQNQRVWRMQIYQINFYLNFLHPKETIHTNAHTEINSKLEHRTKHKGSHPETNSCRYRYSHYQSTAVSENLHDRPFAQYKTD